MPAAKKSAAKKSTAKKSAASTPKAPEPKTRAKPAVIVPEALQSGTNSYAVKDLQVMLSDDGYYEHPITGYYDNYTRNAVAAFQAHLIEQGLLTGVRADGNYSPPTARAAAAYYAP